jgi:peptidoglycan/xylan/chitin deacetylase (PgdA/CDA1 family)
LFAERESREHLPPFMQQTRRTTNARTFDPTWPNGARCAASLTIHIDAQTVWAALGQDSLHNLTLGEFGPRVGAWRILDLLEKYRLKASFFIPGWTAEQYPELARACADAGHEIGYHGYTHTRADAGWTGSGWDRGQEADVLDRTLDLLERITGQRPRGHCFEHSPSTMDLLLERDFLYTNVNQADDIPYWWFRDGRATRLLELPFDWILSDSTQYLHLLWPWVGQPRSPQEAFEIWKAEFDGAYKYRRYFLLTNHPQWSGRASRVMGLEQLLQHILAHDDVWWATTREVAEYWHATYPPESFEALPERTSRDTS